MTASSSSVPRKYSITCPGASDSARVAVSGEPTPVGRRELPGIALAQVRKDLARAPIERAVLCLQDRDLVGAAEGPQLVSFLWPRLDLARDDGSGTRSR